MLGVRLLAFPQRHEPVCFLPQEPPAALAFGVAAAMAQVRRPH